jgi:hypothetical protein
MCLLEGHTEEQLWTFAKATIRAAPVPTVIHSPHPTYETRLVIEPDTDYCDLYFQGLHQYLRSSSWIVTYLN